jgi:hypothetical protein
MIFTIYEAQTGKILRFCNCPENNIADQLLLGEDYIVGQTESFLYYISNKKAFPMPPKPDGIYDFDYLTKQWVKNEFTQKFNIQIQRNQLLQQSDWTQIPNNPLTPEQQEAWAVYRQELRDVTSQSGYPFNVIWPTPPQG